MNVNRKKFLLILVLAFFMGGIGSIIFDRVIIPNLATVPGLSFFNRWQSNSPIVVNRKEEIYISEGSNIAELQKSAQNYTVSIHSLDKNDPRFLGNGIVLSSDGLIFTTKDVIGSAQEFQVVLSNGEVFRGIVRAMDWKSELVAITISGTNLAIPQFGNFNGIQPGQRVLVVGKGLTPHNRLFTSAFVKRTMSQPVDVNVINSADSLSLTLQLDANLEKEFIGGPVTSLEGKVVGVYKGNGLVLPSYGLESGVTSYLETGKFIRPFLGLKYQIITKNIVGLKDLSSEGILVNSVDANSPAARAGLLPGDTITSLNSERLVESNFEYLLSSKKNEAIHLVIVRNRNQINVAVNLEMK